MSAAISCRGLGKQYAIGAKERYSTLRDTLVQAICSPFGGHRREEDTIWALDDVDLTVSHGEAVGIIGPNGAGKSTLLKLLSRITEPTKGSITIRGRVASLLEVGTGFHPELTGRENIYLNGAILGMRKAEIRRKFDEIVAFAEVERFLDTPVKHYSSGMYVRLAFAVAAHLEPEILLVDEVLAVGDAAFQKKCLGKMSHVATEGRTVLFVSHNMAAVTALVRRGVLLDRGRVVEDGPLGRVVATYLKSAFPQTGEIVYDEKPSKEAQLLRLAIRNRRGEIAGVLDPADPIAVEAEVIVREPLRQMHVAFMIELPDGTSVCSSTTADSAEIPDSWAPGRHRVEMIMPGALLNCGQYTVRAGLGRKDGIIIDFHGTDGLSFELTEASEIGSLGGGTQRKGGILAITPRFRVIEREDAPVGAR